MKFIGVNTMKLKVNELIKALTTIKNKNRYVYVASDEEWNTIFTEFKIQYDTNNKAYVIFGLSTTELEDDF